MARLRKIRLVRMTEVLTPVAREMMLRLATEPVRIEQQTEGIEVVRSSTSLSPDLLSEQDTEILQTITPDEWQWLCNGGRLDIEDGWVR